MWIINPNYQCGLARFDFLFSKFFLQLLLVKLNCAQLQIWMNNERCIDCTFWWTQIEAPNFEIQMNLEFLRFSEYKRPAWDQKGYMTVSTFVEECTSLPGKYSPGHGFDNSVYENNLGLWADFLTNFFKSA